MLVARVSYQMMIGNSGTAGWRPRPAHRGTLAGSHEPAPWCECPDAGESRGGGLAIVIGDERVERRDVNCRGNVNCVQGSQRRLAESAGGQQETRGRAGAGRARRAVSPARSISGFERGRSGSCAGRASDCARQARSAPGRRRRDRRRARKVRSAEALGLVPDQLDERRGVGVEDRALSARRGSRRARRLSACGSPSSLKRFRQSRAEWDARTRPSAISRSTAAACRRRRPQLRDRPIAVG